jgi:polyisoprenoid-binding protein YceI
MRKRVSTFPGILAALVLASALPSLAAVETFEIDPAHSSVNFNIRHLVSRTQGRFGKFSGTIEMDRQNPSSAKVKAEIDTASIDTGIPDRDKHLRSPDFFDAEKFPKIVFESTGVVAQGTDKATLKGNLTMHGVTKPVTLEVSALGFGPGMRGGTVAGFEGRTKLSRKDFDISWNRTLDAGSVVLGDDVEIVILLEAGKKADAPAPAAGGSKSSGSK